MHSSRSTFILRLSYLFLFLLYCSLALADNIYLDMRTFLVRPIVGAAL